MSDEKQMPPEPAPQEPGVDPNHPIEVKWFPGDDGDPRCLVTCACGETKFRARIPKMKQPDVEDYLGLDLVQYQKDNKMYKLRKAIPRRLELIALERHLVEYPDCPSVEPLVKRRRPPKGAKPFQIPIGPSPDGTQD